MLLQNKNAVIYGAGGSLGGAVAKALASSGARVFLTGRNLKSVQKVTDKIIADGGRAEAAVVDALDESAIQTHIQTIIDKAGKLDISFNATGTSVVQNVPMVEMSSDDFMNPMRFMLLTQFLTTKSAANQMIKQGSGTILTLTATPGGIGYPYTAGFAPACCALECFVSNFASEIGKFGVRVVNMRSAGSPDSELFKSAIENQPDIMKEVLASMKADTMLKQLPLMSDIANLAVFLSSNLSSKITGVTVDITSGTTSGLNYRVK